MSWNLEPSTLNLSGMARVFMGIGSNEGDRLANISRAIERLGATEGIRLVQMATIAQTKPVGPVEQPDFLNTVVELQTDRSPRDLLTCLKAIEGALGRSPSVVRWGPRVIDLDLLLYDERVIQEPDLVVPHAGLPARRFVLEPLAQLAPELVHPLLRKTIRELLADLGEPVCA